MTKYTTDKIVIKELIHKKTEQIVSLFGISIKNLDIAELLDISYGDLYSYAKKDPSYKGDMLRILNCSLSYKAVLIYRIAHYFYSKNHIDLATKLSEYSKILTNIEIHPAAIIGKNFVLDHGVGTVIGETVTIGDDCYILQEVILGASKIANNKDGQRRHPAIGNRVEIGGFACLYGYINIGDDVKISPRAIIKKDINSNSRVIVTSVLQIEKNELKIKYTGYCINNNTINIFFKDCNLIAMDSIHVICNKHEISSINISENQLSFPVHSSHENDNKITICFKYKETKTELNIDIIN
jgi:serine O-acetyltransferase